MFKDPIETAKSVGQKAVETYEKPPTTSEMVKGGAEKYLSVDPTVAALDFITKQLDFRDIAQDLTGGAGTTLDKYMGPAGDTGGEGQQGAVGGMGDLQNVIPSFDTLSTALANFSTLGPILGDETVNKLIEFKDSFMSGPVQAFTDQVSKLSQVLATTIQLQLLPSEKPLHVKVEIGNMNTIMNKLQGIVSKEIFQSTIDKLQEQINAIQSPMDTKE